MSKKKTRGLIALCASIIVVLLMFITFRFVIPIIKGTISEIPSGRVYTINDVDDTLKELLNKDASRYAYQTLDDKEKKAYDRILYGILNYAARIDIKDCRLSVTDLRRIYSCVRNDYPELFYIHGNCEIYTNTATDLVTDCLPEYMYRFENSVDKAKQLILLRDALKSNVQSLSDYEKAMYYFDYIIDSTHYDTASLDNYNNQIEDPNIDISSSIIGPLFTKKALCEGYSRTYQFLLNSCGIDALYVSGKAKNEDHAWNYVKLDGCYYCVDLTWCDPQSDTDIKSYCYCMINEADFVNRTSDVPYTLPKCDGINYNYYKYNGYELPAFDLNSLKLLFLRGYESGNGFVEFRCLSKACLDAFKLSVSTKEIFDAYTLIEEKYGIDITTLNYVLIDDALVVRINFK